MNLFPKSIRWQIQAWHGFFLVCIVAALVLGFYHYERHSRFEQVDSRLHELIPPVLPELVHMGPAMREGGPPDGARRRRGPGPRDLEQFDEPPMEPPEGPRRHGDALATLQSEGLYYVAWTRDEQISAISPNAPDKIPTPPRPESKNSLLRTRREFRELIHFVPNGARVLIGTSTAPIHKALSELALWLTASGGGVVALGLLGGWWMAGRTIRPIKEISSTAETIAGGDLSKRINIAGNQSELGELATVLNQTFDRLETSFAQQVRFTADASHELRTPIAVMLTQVQLALSRERTPQEYQQTLQTCERAAERMRALVNQLLELARVDSGEFELMREDCDLGRVARESIEFIQPLAQEKNIRLTHSLESIRGKVDTMKLGQVLINLLNNAVQHNPAGIEICLSLQRKGNKALFRVVDGGQGIPAEALPHLFERFYRIDKSRARTKGNSGLGLAICKAIVEAHGGTIRVESAVGSGTTFSIEFPVESLNSTKTFTRIPRMPSNGTAEANATSERSNLKG